MSIDWDKIAGDADRSPRAVLAEFLAMADDIETLVIIVNRVDEEGRDEWRSESSGSSIKAHGLIRAADRFFARWIDGAEEE